MVFNALVGIPAFSGKMQGGNPGGFQSCVEQAMVELAWVRSVIPVSRGKRNCLCVRKSQWQPTS